MAVFKPIPVGIEDFKEIIDMNCYFVDKAMFIRDILDSGSKVTLSPVCTAYCKCNRSKY